MSKHHLRKDPVCENCGHAVELRFCSSCGQENVETRQTFGHLVRHFMEDLTHYESNIWKTVKYLLFRPAYLTQSFLSGKRMTYVPPVKLYIFISFIAFFLPGILPDLNESKTTEHTETTSYGPGGLMSLTRDNKEAAQEKQQTGKVVKPTINGFTSETQYDSTQNALPASKRDNAIKHFMVKRILHSNRLPDDEFADHFLEKMKHNFPKMLFIYLPLFACMLWLFHSKKKWFYFDHAIFTLHYFAFILLQATIISVIAQLIPWHYIMSDHQLSNIGDSIIGLWAIYYFYRAHRKMYGEKWLKSTTIATFTLAINTVLLLSLLFVFVLFTLFSSL